MGFGIESNDTWQGGSPASVPVTAPVSRPVAVNLDTLANLDVAALLEGNAWQGTRDAEGRTVLTYSFTAAGSAFSVGDLFAGTLTPFSPADRALVRHTLATIEAVAAVRFVEVPDTGAQGSTLRYGYSEQPNDMGFAGYTFFPSASPQAGDVWLGADQSAGQWDAYRPDLLLHETLHALGLKHPFEGAHVLGLADDVIPNTVMSYSAVAGTTQGMLSSYPAEPMLADVRALQALYGAAAHNAGDTTYRLDAPQWQGGFHVLWDSAGVDTLDAHAMQGPVQLDLGAGARSDIGATVFASALLPGGGATSVAYHQTLAIAQGTLIEHAIGSAFDDVLQGNAAGNALVGGAGNDRLVGLGGDDWLAGGTGNNWLDGGDGVDTAVFARPVGAYAFSADDQHIYVHDLVAGTVDTLTHVERAVFSDFTYSPPGMPTPVVLLGMPAFA